MSKEKIKLAFIGYGQRGPGLLKSLAKMPDVEIVAVCDKYEDRTRQMIHDVKEAGGCTPYAVQDYREIIANLTLDAAVVCTSWSMHIPITVAFMEAGVAVGFEVGGCDSIEQCWELVRTHRKTGVHCMMLENCCYGKREMMLLNMAEQGFFGEIVHVEGSYTHFLASQILAGKEKRHYRLANYLHRNCDNYPTHAFGPLCKLLGINHGNRLVSLTSTASKAVGLKSYMRDNEIENKDLINERFMQGDVVTTTIKCAHGETITLKLDTTLPAFGSRTLAVAGTRARFDERTCSFFELGKDDPEGLWRSNWGNEREYEEQYMHPLWKQYKKEGVQLGHGGMDWLVLRAFVESVKSGTRPPIDAYDAATWMSITPLSEMSIAMGGMPVEIPDFTYGQWIEENVKGD